MNNIIKLLIKVIDKGKVVKLLRNIIYPDGIKCPICGNRKINRKSKKHTFPRQYKCSCGHCFSETDGTILRHCRINQIGIVKVFLVIILICLKLSINSISKMLEINRKTAFRLGESIFGNLYAKRRKLIFEGESEIDEVYITSGSKGRELEHRKGRKRSLKLRGRGTYNKDKPPILGIVNRNTHLIQLFVCLNVIVETVKPLIRNVLSLGSIVYTDEYSIYNWLIDFGYNHRVVSHSSGFYAIDLDQDGINETHCNTIEGIWSLLRQYLRQFRGISKEKLKYYVNFFEYSYNSNKLNYTGEEILTDLIKSYT
jgi:transposase